MALKFAANLSMLYPEWAFLDRFAAARNAGFDAVEFLFPYQFGYTAIRQRLDEHGLQAVLFNISPGDYAAGDRGTLSHPERKATFRQTMEEALTYAHYLQVPRIHVMVGNRLPGVAPAMQFATILENLAWAAPLAQTAGVTLLIEPLNATDQPYYFVHSTLDGMAIVRALNHPHVRLQYDFYHAQMTEGNLLATMQSYLPWIGHLQISDVPGRHEPGSGEINYPAIFAKLEQLAYSGYIGLEYIPTGDTEQSLAWLPVPARRSRTAD
ncbi:MAG: TIM barrel protein [Caldilineaceae bacterium]|nr:TIM barrel protein [Caldilineaceae bacterium]